MHLARLQPCDLYTSSKDENSVFFGTRGCESFFISFFLFLGLHKRKGFLSCCGSLHVAILKSLHLKLTISKSAGQGTLNFCIVILDIVPEWRKLTLSPRRAGACPLPAHSRDLSKRGSAAYNDRRARRAFDARSFRKSIDPSRSHLAISYIVSITSFASNNFLLDRSIKFSICSAA